MLPADSSAPAPPRACDPVPPEGIMPDASPMRPRNESGEENRERADNTEFVSVVGDGEAVGPAGRKGDAGALLVGRGLI